MKGRGRCSPGQQYEEAEPRWLRPRSARGRDVARSRLDLVGDAPAWRRVFAIASGLLLGACATNARDIHVNNQTGADSNSGTPSSPLKSIRHAVAMASEGDVIHLLPEESIYREMLTLRNKRGLTFEGHDCVVTAADKLPADPTQWENVGENLHRIRLKRNIEDRYVLVVGGKAEMMGRTKYNTRLNVNERRDAFEAVRQALMKQFPRPEELRDGQFSWEPIDAQAGWLYVRGPLENLEWSVRPQGVATEGEVHDIVFRNLHVRHALNDGWNFHGNAQNIRLYNVSGHECYDNGISPHGACSFEVEDGRFLRNELCIGNDFLTETKFLRCEIGDSVQEEIMIIGGRHLFEDCLIRSTGPVAIRLVYSKPGSNRPMALKEIEASGKDPDMKPEYVFRNCTIESADGRPRMFIIDKGVNLILEKCTFKGIAFQASGEAHVVVIGCTLDGRPLTEAVLKGL